MAVEWHYTADGESFGPYSEEEISNLITEGVVTADTLVWQDGFEDWVAASQTELADVINARSQPASGGVSLGLTKQCTLCHNRFPAGELVDIDGALVCAGCKPQFLRRMQEGEVTPGGYRFAGFWIRVGATILDNIILTVCQMPISFVLGMIMGFVGEMDEQSRMLVMIVVQIVNISISILVPCLYEVIFVCKKNATPGKMAAGIKVINADGTEKISTGKSIGRYFAKMLSGLILCIGYLMVAFDDEKRGLHDRLCNTRVVYKS